MNDNKIDLIYGGRHKSEENIMTMRIVEVDTNSYVLETSDDKFEPSDDMAICMYILMYMTRMDDKPMENYNGIDLFLNYFEEHTKTVPGSKMHNNDNKML